MPARNGLCVLEQMLVAMLAVSVRQTLRCNSRIQFKTHHSIAVAKSSTTKTPDRLYAKVGKPFKEIRF